MIIKLVRHGQSMANMRELQPAEVGDHTIPLTALGREQAIEAGGKVGSAFLKALVYCSPFRRARETIAGVIAGAEVAAGLSGCSKIPVCARSSTATSRPDRRRSCARTARLVLLPLPRRREPGRLLRPHVELSRVDDAAGRAQEAPTRAHRDARPHHPLLRDALPPPHGRGVRRHRQPAQLRGGHAGPARTISVARVHLGPLGGRGLAAADGAAIGRANNGSHLVNCCMNADGEPMNEQRFPPRWDEVRVREVLAHYESQTEDEQFARSRPAVINPRCQRRRPQGRWRA